MSLHLNPRLLLPLLLLGASLPALALNPDRRLTQYGHTAWRVQDGVLPAIPNAVGQTADGYLWIGTDAGLVRFDGVRFTPWTPPANTQLPSPRIISLLGARDGSLWVGTGTGLAHWQGGNLSNLGAGLGRINVIREDPDGAVWFARSRVADPTGGLCHAAGLTVRCYGPKDGFPFGIVVPMTRDGEGNFWAGGPETIARWRPGSSTSYHLKALRGTAGLLGVTSLATGPNGIVWAGLGRTPISLRHLENGEWKQVPQLPQGVEVAALFTDSSNRLWIGTTTHGLYLLYNGAIEHFGPEDGLSSGDISDLFEDHEGNMWVVTSKGLDRFRDLAVTTYSLREGLTADHAEAVLATRDGRLWVSNAGALDALRDATFESFRTGNNLPGHNVTSLLEDQRGRLWAGIDSGLWILEGGRFREVPGLHGGHTGIVRTMTAGENGEVWAQILGSRHLSRIRETGVVEEIPPTRVPPVVSQVSDGQGGLWLGGRGGELLHYHGGRLDRFPSKTAGARAGFGSGLRREPDGSVWVGGGNGLLRWKDGASQDLSTRNGLPCPTVLDSRRDLSGDLWILTSCGMSLVSKAELARWFAHPETGLAIRNFDALDGLSPGTPTFAPSLTSSADGRLWFVNDRTLQMIDPKQVDRHGPPPIVQIERVVADARTYALDAGLDLPPLTSDLEIDYTAACLSLPERVRFRYLLEGHDEAWQQPGARRQAFYSGLGPGHYSFRVIASDVNGRWVEPGTALSFTIQPAFYETLAFRLLAAAGVLLALWLGYRWRVRQIASALTARFDERLAERTRLARELHDTLLQTIQGSRLVAEDALSDPADAERMRRALQRLSGWLSQATREGRDAVNALRASTTRTNDLAEGLRQSAEESVRPGTLDLSITSSGPVRQMHPILRDDLFHAGAEAIRNAIRHSGGTSIRVELTYGANLSLKIIDNGQGIPEEIVERGKSGHFGLTTMRERIERIGGQMRLFSHPGAGTEVEFTIPGSLLYLEKTKSRRFGILN